MIQWLAKTIYHLIGWKVVGRYPREIKKKVLVVAPHTSSWDVPVGLLVKVWLKMDDVTFYAKKELFTGLQGRFLRFMGAAPVDRGKNNNLVGQVLSDFKNKDHHTILITPEGTRRKVAKFKTGFYYMANKADVPIIPIIFDFEEKAIKFLEPYYTSGDLEKEVKEIEDIFRGVPGKVREYSFT